jgi:CRP-like cAMP-binding protein
MPPANPDLNLLDAPLRDELRKVSHQLELQRGDFVYKTGDAAKGLYFVETGLVGLLIVGPSGKEHLMRFFKSGQVFGHRALLADQVYHATAQVLEATRLIFVPKHAVAQILDKYPELYRYVVRQLAEELTHCERQQVQVLDHQILPRVARAVVFLKDLHPDYKWTRSEIASFCASTTSTVIKALAELESMGLLKQKGRGIEILDRAGLIHLQFQRSF